MKNLNFKKLNLLYLVLGVVFINACKPEKYKTTKDVCVRGHYEIQMIETGGLSTSKSTMTTNRTEEVEVYICDEYKVDTVECVRWVLK